MGAVASNIRKRRDYYCESPVSSSPAVDQSYGHISKKPKLSFFTKKDTPEYNLSCSVVSRVSLYPDSKPRFPREVHAPVRHSRFGLLSRIKKFEGTASFRGRSAEKMGNCLGIQSPYEKLRSGAIKSLKYIWKDSDSCVGKDEEKVVIEIDDDDEETRGDASDDSSIEEVEIGDFLRSKSKEGYGLVDNSHEQKLKMGEKDLQSLDSSVVTNVSNANEKLEGVEKMMEGMALEEELDDSAVPVHKKLYDFTKMRDEKLNRLGQDIEYNEKHLQQLQLLWPQKRKEQIKKDVVEECFLPLTEEEEALVTFAFSDSNRRKVLVSHENSNIYITGEKLQCLRPGTWLNDEVVNLYLELLKEREKREPQKFLKCHFFNTFFYKKLLSGKGGYDFQSVRRWTTQRKLGYSLSDCEKIFVPIHEEIHWCLAIINKKDKKFQYLDSLKGVDEQALKVVARYYVDEIKDKSGQDIDVSSWEEEFVSNHPEQENMFDCGMFMIKYTDFYSRDIGLCFNQGHMPYFRRRTAKEILTLRAE